VRLTDEWTDFACEGGVEVAPGMVAPGRCGARALDFAGYDVAVELQIQRGLYVCTRLDVYQRGEGEPISGEGVRSMPVAGLTRYVAAAALAGLGRTFGPGQRFAGRRPSDDAIQGVAHVYRHALLFGDPPTKAVAEELGLSPATAGRWVALARAAKYLGPAEVGKAGA
jgi:hypothetical protein